MQKAFVLFLLSTVTAVAVAVPPYEPLPGSASAQVQTNTDKTRSAGSGSQSGSGNGSGLGYKSAVDSGSESTGGPTLNTGSNWETYSQIQQMQQELQEVRGMVEELNHQIKLMQKQGRERYLDLDMRINKLGGESSDPDSSARGGNSVPKMDDKELYEHTSSLRKQGKYDEAISGLHQLLSQSPKGMYAPYAEYWLGELYMVSKPASIEKSKRHFINLLAGYPGHVKVPDAMFKLGKLYAGQGETGKAKSVLSELVNKYPDKSAAKLAKDLLKTL
ncbi:tol-pal system protein YbgF [Ketobacter sp.]